MKFLMSIVVYLIMAAILGLGILQAVHGKPWLLISGVVVYALMLALLGCLPKKAH
jgi:hypothetical protein